MTKQQIDDYTDYDKVAIREKYQAIVDGLTNNWPGTGDNISAAQSIEVLRADLLKVLKFLNKSLG